jgi:hypothetical protein
VSTITTTNGVKVRCTARKTFAVVAEVEPHARFTGRYENGAPVWEDVPARAVVLFRSDSSEAVVRKVNSERRSDQKTRGPGRSIGVFNLATGQWVIPIAERVTIREYVAAGR